MLIANKLIPRGRGLAAALLRRACPVELPWDVRQRSRFEAGAGDATLQVFLPRGTIVRGGDVLVATDGSLHRVQAAAEPVLVVQACAEHGTPLDLLRAAYHLGNRHVPLELRADRLLLEPDHVLAALLRRMHLLVSEGSEPFEPESGAYGGTPSARPETGDASSAGGHRHGHAGGAHAHEHDHGPAHAHPLAHDGAGPRPAAAPGDPTPGAGAPAHAQDHGLHEQPDGAPDVRVDAVPAPAPGDADGPVAESHDQSPARHDMQVRVQAPDGSPQRR